MFDVGRICVKTAGRNAGRIVVIVEKTDDNFVIVDGNVKRKRCNVKHLEPTGKVVKISKGEKSEKIKEILSKEGFDFRLTKPKDSKERPRKERKVKLEAPKPTKSEELEVPKPVRGEEVPKPAKKDVEVKEKKAKEKKTKKVKKTKK